MIEVQHLRKEYGDTVAVADVSFHVNRGEVLGFLGPNAAGKTTTMRMLTGFLPPTSGQASIAGFDVTDQPLQARRRIGYLPENVPLYDEMPVGRYLAFMARIKNVPPAQIRSRVQAVMQAVHITDRDRQTISKLSKGLRQRVGIAQAMIHDPDVLILDEPTVGLDPHQVIEVRELIRSLRQDHTIILSTHILSEASMVCDRIVIIHEGRIIAEDSPEALMAHLMEGQQVEVVVRGPSPDVQTALAAVPGVVTVSARMVDTGPTSSPLNSGLEWTSTGLTGLVAPPGSEDSGSPAVGYVLQAEPHGDIREIVAATIVQHGWGLLEMRQVSLTLEEIFLRMTTSRQGNHPSDRQNNGNGDIQPVGTAQPRDAAQQSGNGALQHNGLNAAGSDAS